MDQQTIKGKVRAAIPRPLLRSAVTWRERARLARVQTKSFDLSRLRSLSEAGMRETFTDPDIDAAWAKDFAAVRERMPISGPSGTCLGERRAIYYLVAALKPRRVLEVGTHLAASTLLIAKALATHVGHQARLTTVDIFDVNDARTGAFARRGLSSPRAIADQLGLSDIVQFETRTALDLLGETEERFDLIFLDGDHSAVAVYQEVAAALSRLARDGTILLHDYHPNNQHVFKTGSPIPGPYLAGLRIAREQGRSVGILPLGNLPWPTKDGVNATCLALVNRRSDGSA
jgi:predicted O-methyltransferase YrrM